MSAKPYTGPSVPDMIRDKTLAENIITYHNHPTSDSILDDDNLNMLRRFVEDPSKREQILRLMRCGRMAGETWTVGF
jgi:hypothetical protein